MNDNEIKCPFYLGGLCKRPDCETDYCTAYIGRDDLCPKRYETMDQGVLAC